MVVVPVFVSLSSLYLVFFICLEVSNVTEEALFLVLSLFSFMRDAAVGLEMYILDLQLS